MENMAEALSAGGVHGEESECKICYNYFDLERHSPKLLSCSHTFCLECLETLHFREGRGWRIVCPVCRHRTPLPERRVRNLPDNTALTEELSHKKREPEDSLNAERLPGPPASPATSTETGHSGWEACKHVAFKTSYGLIVSDRFANQRGTYPLILLRRPYEATLICCFLN
uniref:RING-type domain-containing protein n=1 Tax=Neolamprologus brichardi TaxID=32507 RepID=A0A3Q4HNN4_NEOBR